MNDKDHRNTAGHILDTAKKVVTTERGGQHGGAEDSFQTIADLWVTYLQGTNRERFEVDGRIRITSKDVAWMMVLLKIARNVHGQTKEDDFVDAAGYTSLAAALAGIQVPEMEFRPFSPKINEPATMACMPYPSNTPPNTEYVPAWHTPEPVSLSAELHAKRLNEIAGAALQTRAPKPEDGAGADEGSLTTHLEDILSGLRDGEGE